MAKKFFSFISRMWTKRQEESMREEYELLKGVWHQEYESRKTTWSEFKRNNAVVNDIMNRIAA